MSKASHNTRRDMATNITNGYQKQDYQMLER